MPVRPPGLIRQTIGDNVQQVEQVPSTVNESDFFRSESLVIDTESDENAAANLAVGKYGGLDGNLKDVYLTGSWDGFFQIYSAETGTWLSEPNVPGGTGRVVSVAFADDNKIVGLTEDGSLGVLNTTDSDFGSISLGGTPRCLIETDADGNVYAGDPSGVLYSMDERGNKRWETTIQGGIGGGFAIDSNYIYGGSGTYSFRVKKSDGTLDWTNEALSNIGRDGKVLGKVAVDDSKAYFSHMHPDAHEIRALDKETGDTVWFDKEDHGNGYDEFRSGVVLDGNGTAYVYPHWEDNTKAYDADNGNVKWTYDGVNPLGGNSGNLIAVNISLFGSSVMISAGPSPSSPPSGDVVTIERNTGNEKTALGFQKDVRTAIESHGTFGSAFGYAEGSGKIFSDVKKLDGETTGTLGPVKVGSRPFLSVASESVGTVGLNVYGINSETGTRYKQDSLTLPPETSAEQLPWWSWPWVEFELDDKNATAGDTTLYLSASR